MRNNIKKNRIMWFIQTGKKGHEQSDRVPSGHSGTVRVGSNGWDPTGAGSVSSCGHMRTVCAVRYWPEPRTVLLLKTKHQLAFYSCGADGQRETAVWYNSYSESHVELLQLPNEMLAVSFLSFTSNQPLSQSCCCCHRNKETAVHRHSQVNKSYLEKCLLKWKCFCRTVSV